MILPRLRMSVLILERYRHAPVTVISKFPIFMFDKQGKGLCLIDLDTLGPLPWPVEMADAFRSWCAPCQEDDPDAYFDLVLFESALKGYFSTMASLWTQEEKAALVPRSKRFVWS